MEKKAAVVSIDCLCCCGNYCDLVLMTMIPSIFSVRVKEAMNIIFKRDCLTLHIFRYFFLFKFYVCLWWMYGCRSAIDLKYWIYIRHHLKWNGNLSDNSKLIRSTFIRFIQFSCVALSFHTRFQYRCNTMMTYQQYSYAVYLEAHVYVDVYSMRDIMNTIETIAYDSIFIQRPNCNNGITQETKSNDMIRYVP